jgi:hypothetical protein
VTDVWITLRFFLLELWPKKSSSADEETSKNDINSRIRQICESPEYENISYSDGLSLKRKPRCLQSGDIVDESSFV